MVPLPDRQLCLIWPRPVTSWLLSFMTLCQFASKLVHSFSKHGVHTKTVLIAFNRWTNTQTNKWTGRKHNVSGCSLAWHSVLHWLDVTDRVRFRVCIQMFKCLHGKAPDYLSTMCHMHPDSLDARTFALWIADSSTFHALHCRRAVFEPSRMLVHLCGTLCPFISRTTIWLLQLSWAILSLISFLSTDFVLSAFGVWSHKRAI